MYILYFQLGHHSLKYLSQLVIMQKQTNERLDETLVLYMLTGTAA